MNINQQKKPLALSTNVTPRMSRLALAVIASLASIGGVTLTNPAFAGDTVSCKDAPGACTNGSNTSDIKKKVGLLPNTLTTALNKKRTATNSLTGNTVTLDYSGTNTINYVAGAVTYARNAEVNNNTVMINKGTVGKEVFGGYSYQQGAATGNSVTISGGTVGRDVYGGSGPAAATGNSVTISGGSVGNHVYGGFSTSGNATGNRVTISGGSLGRDVYGGYSKNGNATDNRVTISGSTVAGNVIGGISENGTATGNSITISGGSVGRHVYGGFSLRGDPTGNTVTIAAGSPITFGTNTELYGGMSYGRGKDVFTGNTLNIHRKGVRVADINTFENYNFYLQPDVQNGDTILTLTSEGTTDLSKSKIAIGVETTNGNLQKGHTVTLIKKTSTAEDAKLVLPTALGTDGAAITGIAGVSTLFNFKVADASNNKTLVAKLASTPKSKPGSKPAPADSGRLNPQTKAFLESRLANVSFVERSTDLATGNALSAMTDATNNSGVSAFGATSYTRDKTATGSHINVKGSEFVLGIGTGMHNSAGTLSVGGFVESGFGSYNAYNDFNDRQVSDVRSSGDTKYYGIGAMAKQTFTNNLDLSTAMSVGLSNTSFHTDDMLNATGRNTRSDLNNRYVSAFAELGYTAKIDSTTTVRPYVNVKNAHIASNSQVIARDRFTFDSVNSTRATSGARFDKAFNDSVTGYADIAWENQFAGEANGKVFKGGVTRSIDSPTLKGNTAILAVGVTVKPAGNNNFTFTIGAKGSAGKRRGGSVNTGLHYKF